MNNSKISWTDDTANPIHIANSKAFYCIRISPGCKNCYAATMSRRLAGMGHDAVTYDYKHYPTHPELELNRKMLASWAKKTRPRKIFVSSMTDIFADEFVPTAWMFEILQAMSDAPQHTFQVLTKRADNMKCVVDTFCHINKIDELPKNIWLGVSVEDQQRAQERIYPLLNTRCQVRFLSVEPLLDKVNISDFLSTGKINWVIVGGESGHGARFMLPDWVRSIRDQCKEAEVAFFFKQWGDWLPWEDCSQKTCMFEKVGKKISGNLLDGIVYEEFPNIDL